MRLFATTLTAMSLAAASEAQPAPTRVAPPIVHETTPALGTYTDQVLFGEVWERRDLLPRDRSMVTIVALIAGGHTAQMAGHFERALNNGVTPGEIAGVITHLAFYAGWPNAMSAVGVAKEVFDKRGIEAGPIVTGQDELLPFDEAKDAPRAAAVQEQVGTTVPALANYTNGVLFRDLWQRADLRPRDRSLVTIVALIAAGQVEQLTFHMNRGLDNGLSQTQISEVITHLAFYAGWPRAISAVTVAKAVFEARRPTQAQTSGSSNQQGTTLDILRHGSQPSTQGPADYFTGSVRIDSRFQRDAPARVGGASVSFEPGARSAWHTHPLGQTIIVTSGRGWAQREGGPVEEIRPGDVVWFPPGERHWHGARPDSAMTHIAIAESLDGKVVDWMEQVSDEQYAGQGSNAAR